MEKTVIILKPDAFEKRKVGVIITRFEDAGFNIIASKMMHLNSEIIREHYSHIADEPFFPRIDEFMSSRPVIVMVLEGESAIDHGRHLIGPTNSLLAPGGTIRGNYGTDMMRNVIHASDGVENAAAEIKRFFSEDEVYG